jgi:hypothetical protein
LLAGLSGTADVVARGSGLPPFDLQAPFLTLPRVFHTDLSNIPADLPYIHANINLIDRWRRELKESSPVRQHPSADRFLIGIIWQGDPAHPFRERSIALTHFTRLLQVPGVQLISLQKGPGAEQLAELREVRNEEGGVRIRTPVIDEDTGPFMDTAAIMMNVDLVISADTATLHLAGALGVPTWVPLPLVPEWRWLLEREDCPWYPTLRLFRQTRRGQWEDVFERMAREVERLHKRGVRQR